MRELRRRLLDGRNTSGHWTGELSTSALSTATASFALQAVDRASDPSSSGLDGPHRALVERGLEWLARNANDDGGWGDTDRSASNISTTTLCWCALSAPRGGAERFGESIRAAERWLETRAGSLQPAALARAIIDVYGEDRTFSVPILTMAALAGRLGEGSAAWRHVPALPFELAVLPHRLFPVIGLPVVSYALPALIAIGQARHRHAPSRNPLVRAARSLSEARTRRVLRAIQPASGGYLEAVPLTSFVVMSLAGIARPHDEVARAGVDFLHRSVRSDGSWPIDSNLATFVTTLAVNALAESGGFEPDAGADDRAAVRQWLLEQQYTDVHPYTRAAPGGWAWTDLSGGVPDADDTAGALVALRELGPPARDGGGEEAGDGSVGRAAAAGLRWLCGLQNRDGGVPTFCRGWGKLPFDRSGSDLTAHALRAFVAWRRAASESPGLPIATARLDAALRGFLRYLETSQRDDGAWTPLWFGNEEIEGFENPLYGTARVLRALTELEPGAFDAPRDRGLAWLLAVQNDDGGWGGNRGATSSIEETALAVEALAAPQHLATRPEARAALERGIDRLLDWVETHETLEATAIGFYFANLWYYEKLYPLIFTTAALGRAATALQSLEGRGNATGEA